MAKLANWGKARRLRAYALATILLALLAAAPLCAAAEPAVSAPSDHEKPNFVMRVLQNLFNSRELVNILGEPEYTIAAFIILNTIVFVETGLFCFLPGDSLLVTAGIVCSVSGWNLPLLIGTLCLAAILGDSVGYTVGWHTGPKIFCREKSWFFNKDHLFKAQRFYERHGGKTIVLARFMPIIRTFAPVVAGVGKMRYRRFLAFNIVGGIGWVTSMILLGYYLHTVVNKLFGFDVHDHIEKVVILVVLLSISPGIVLWLRKKLGTSRDAPAPPVSATSAAAEPELAEAGK
jgi:membrane-associated protein